MRIENTFLRSAVARRVFWVMLAAAGLPLAVFAALAYGTLTNQIETQSRQRLQDAAKYSGLRAYDRLVAAQGALAAIAAGAATSVTPTADTPPLAAREMLRALATIEHASGQIRGDGGLVEVWRRLDEAQAAQAGSKRRVWWQGDDGPRGALIIVGVRDAGRWWLAEVSPEFLWSDLRDSQAAERTCVHDDRGSALLCGAAGASVDAGPSVSWRLFLGGDFAAPDWVFTRHADGSPLTRGEATLQRLAWLSAVATLMLVGVLSLVLVRRSTEPLEKLIDGTRRLARRDWSARVELSANDEYAQLAQSFNQMAERIGSQVQALQVQSTIDREILGGLDLARLAQQVVARLGALQPQARVAVLIAPPVAGRWCSLGAGHDEPRALSVAPDIAASFETPGRTRLPHALLPWAQQLLAGEPGGGDSLLIGPAAEATEVHAWAARSAGQTLGVMLVAATAAPAEDVEDSLGALCDRFAVSLAASARERALRERAERDSLTGLLNRAGMAERLDGLLAGAGDAGALTLLYIDLDGFKEVNDTLGHPSGDALLCQVARMLEREAAGALLVARPGGDEFVVVVCGGAREAASELAARLCRAIEQPWQLDVHSVRIGASIGMVASPEHGRDRIELLRRADMAMYAAKGAGRGRHAWFDVALDARAAERNWLLRELRAALAAGHLLLHYQPRVAADDQQPGSVEALVRWRHPERGLIGPHLFITLAEETGLIEPLGNWVLDEACRQLSDWRRRAVPVARVAVNVSAIQLQADDFADRVLATLARHRLQGRDLEIEITESLFVSDNVGVMSQLQRLRGAGVQVALDDFGTGFSSLSSLYRLPVDVLKIDRSFVVDLGQREAADAVARSIVALARALGKQVVAEGIETEAQQRLLLLLGCDELQGYLFSRPLPPAELEALYGAVDAAGADALMTII